MKVLLTSTLALGALCAIAISQPAVARGGGHGGGHGGWGHGGGHGGWGHGYGHGYYGHGYGGWGYGVGAVGVGVGLGAVGATIVNDEATTYQSCGYNQWGEYVCYNY